MNAWLNSHFNSLMADINDKDIVAASQLKVTSGSDNTNRQAEKVNEVAEKTEKDGDTKNDNGPTKTPKANGSLIKTTDKQKEKDDAVLKRRVQKDIAEAMLTKRETTKDSHKDCVSRKEFLELKAEVRRLKRKLQASCSPPPVSPQQLSAPLSSPSVSAKQLSFPGFSPPPVVSAQQFNAPVSPSPVSTQFNAPLSLPPVSTQPLNIPLSPSPVFAQPSNSPLSPPHVSAQQLISPFMSPPPTFSSEVYNNYTRNMLQDLIGHTDDLYPAIKILLLRLFPEAYIVSHSVSGKASNSKNYAKPPCDSRLYGVMLSILKDKFGSSSKEITEKVHSVQKCISKKVKSV